MGEKRENHKKSQKSKKSCQANDLNAKHYYEGRSELLLVLLFAGNHGSTRIQGACSTSEEALLTLFL